MTFAVPLFLIASLAGIVPVILHMIHRQKVRDLPFSTLRFLRISAEKTRRRRRIHDLLLMALRILVLLLIAFGLAKPTLTNLAALWGGGTRTAVAIVLDNSASMGMIDRNRMRLATALGAAEQIMGELHKGDPVALLLTGGPRFPEQGKPDRTHEKVRQMLSQCGAAGGPGGKPKGLSYERADLAADVRQARKLLADSDADHKYIYVLTDLQALSWEGLTGEHESGTAARADQQPGRKDPPGRDVPVIFVDCNRSPQPNVAVTKVDLETALPVTGQPVKVTAELLNASPVPRQRHLELYVDGVKQAGSRLVEIPPGGRVRYDEPDFRFVCSRGGLRRGEVRLVGKDGNALDDRRFFTIEIDQGIPVAVVKPKRHEIPYLEDTFYVEQALAPGKSADWALRTDVLTAGDLPSEQLSRYKVVYCVNLPAPDEETTGRLRGYVEGGGKLVWICGESVDADAYNRSNQQAGGNLLPAPLLDVRAPAAGEDRDSWNVTFLDGQHPALGQLVEPASLYLSVLIYKHVRIDAAAAPGLRVLARLDDGEPLLVQRDVKEGEVLMLGTSAHIDWSNLPLRPIFLPLLAQLTFELAGAERTRHESLAGAPLVLPMEDRTAAGIVEVITPTDETFRLDVAPRDGTQARSFRYADTHEIGVYRLHPLGAVRGRPIAYAVNLDPDEADPTKIEREELRRRFGATPLVFAEDPDDLSGTFAWLREGKGLWELFLAGVLVALVIETFLSNRLSPKQEEDRADQRPPGLRGPARAAPGAA
jgi:hypothetical protein